MPKNRTMTTAPPDMRGTNMRPPGQSEKQDFAGDRGGRSADTLPAIQDAEDLERVKSKDKSGSRGGRSREA